MYVREREEEGGGGVDEKEERGNRNGRSSNEERTRLTANGMASKGVSTGRRRILENPCSADAEIVLVPDNIRSSAILSNVDPSGNYLHRIPSAGRCSSLETPLLEKWNRMLGLPPTPPAVATLPRTSSLDRESERARGREQMVLTAQPDKDKWSDRALAHLYANATAPQHMALAAQGRENRAFAHRATSEESGARGRVRRGGNERHPATWSGEGGRADSGGGTRSVAHA